MPVAGLSAEKPEGQSAGSAGRAVLRPLAEAPVAVLARIRLLATDIDDTMTQRDETGASKLRPEILQALLDLQAAGIEVVPVTGRPAGEALGMARYLPTVRRAIAENGGALLVPDAEVEFLQARPDVARLHAAAAHLGRDRPWTLAPDAFCRVSDVAWLREERDRNELAELRNEAVALGVYLIWSSVHIHLSMHPPDKGLGVLRLAQRLGLQGHELATIGDSPNDEGLWQPGRFGVTVGTAAVLHQRDVLAQLPEYVVADAGAGWLELAARLLAAR